MKKHNFGSKCAYTGKDDGEIAFTIFVKGNFEDFAYISESAYKEKIRELENIKEKTEIIKENHLLGIIGAVLGIIPGIALRIILPRLRLFSIFSAFLAGVGPVTGYRKLGKKAGIFGALISVIITVAGVITAHLINIIFILKEQMESIGQPIDFRGSMGILWEQLPINEKFRKEVMFDRYFIFVLIVAVIIAFINIKSAYNASNGNYKIKRMI